MAVHPIIKPDGARYKVSTKFGANPSATVVPNPGVGPPGRSQYKSEGSQDYEHDKIAEKNTYAAQNYISQMFL